MLNLALMFFIIALSVALFLFGGIAGGAAIAQFLCFIFLQLFLVLFLLSVIAGFLRRRRP